MAIDTTPPRWLESLAARPVDYSGLGQAAGKYLGALGTTALGSGDEQIDKQPFGQRYRTNLTNTYKQAADPNWRIHEVMARAQYEHAKLQGQSLALRGAMEFQKMQQQLDSDKELASLWAKTKSSGGDPTNIPYEGNNPITRNFWTDAQVQYSRSTANLARQEHIKTLNDMMAKLDLPDFVAASNMPDSPTGLPTDEKMTFIRGAAQKRMSRELLIQAAKMDEKPTQLQKNVQDIFTLEDEATQLLSKGDKTGAKSKQDQAALMRENLKGQNMVLGYDDQGRPIVTIGKGAGPTIATQSDLQKKMVKYENAVELISYLENNLRSGHLGIKGVIGENIGDRLLPQFGFDTSNKERVDVRTAMKFLSEGLMREVSEDTRFSNADREEIKKALPSTGAMESLPDAINRLETIRRVLSNRGQVMSETLHKTPALWSLTPNEIGQLVSEKKIDEKVAAEALRRFHGYP